MTIDYFLSVPPSNQPAHYEADILCPPGVTGLFAYPFDYTVFINCRNGHTAIQNCAANMVYSITKGYCDTAKKIARSERVAYRVSEVSYEYCKLKRYQFSVNFVKTSTL